MTSTYLPFLTPFFAPARLGAAGPSRSSISLAPLMLVAGLDGGLDGGPFQATLPTGPPTPGLLALLPIDGAPPASPIGGADSPPPRAGEDVGGVGGGPMSPLGVLEGGANDLGGGGVDVEAGVTAEAPPALFTHLPRSLSKTKEFSSPSLALMGPVCGALGSFLLPNQPPTEGSQLARFAFDAASFLAALSC
jgi:hypothetical protein